MVVGRYFSTQRNSSDTKILQVHFACLIHNDKRWLKPTMQLIILDHLIPKVNTDISKIISRIQLPVFGQRLYGGGNGNRMQPKVSGRKPVTADGSVHSFVHTGSHGNFGKALDAQQDDGLL